MYTASDLRKGLKIEIEGVPYAITEFTFMKPGKGQAIYTCKLKSLLNGTTMTRSYRSNDKLDKPELRERALTYSYQDGDNYIFMDENYEQITIGPDILGDARYFLTEDICADVLFHNDRPIEVVLPNFIEKEIVHTEPGAKGNTATNVMKPGKIDTGYVVQIPLFVNQGDIIKVDTRTGEYADRVSKKS